MRGNRLGAILVRMGAIDLPALRRGLARHWATGRPLGRCLLDLRLCPEDAVATALATQRVKRSGAPDWGSLLREINLS